MNDQTHTQNHTVEFILWALLRVVGVGPTLTCLFFAHTVVTVRPAINTCYYNGGQQRTGSLRCCWQHRCRRPRPQPRSCLTPSTADAPLPRRQCPSPLTVPLAPRRPLPGGGCRSSPSTCVCVGAPVARPHFTVKTAAVTLAGVTQMRVMPLFTGGIVSFSRSDGLWISRCGSRDCFCDGVLWR